MEYGKGAWWFLVMAVPLLTSLTFARPEFSCFVADVDAPRVVVVGLKGPFRLEDLLSRRHPSRILGGQPALGVVHSQRRVKIVPTLSLYLVWRRHLQQQQKI